MFKPQEKAEYGADRKRIHTGGGPVKRQGKQNSINTLLGALTEAESKALYDEQDTSAYDLDCLLETFLHKDNDPVRIQLLKEYEAGLPVTGPEGIRKRLGAIDMEFFGRAYFPHYFSRL